MREVKTIEGYDRETLESSFCEEAAKGVPRDGNWPELARVEVDTVGEVTSSF